MSSTGGARTASPVALRALGGLDLVGFPDGPGASPLLRQPKRLAILAYLVLRPGGDFVARDRLLAVFWPDRPPAPAGTALRQSLSFLRAQVGDGLVTRGRHGVGMAIESDASAFDRLIEAGRPAEALALYRGDLLDGFYFDGESAAFREWVENARARYRRSAAGAAWTLALGAEAEARPADAAFWAKRFLGLVEWSEPEVRRAMELLHRVGDGAGALRAYRGLEGWLRFEMGSAPSAATRSLVQSIRTDPETTRFGGRRSGEERRRAARRQDAGERSGGPERRVVPDRRSAPRRSGRDRRGD